MEKLFFSEQYNSVSYKDCKIGAMFLFKTLFKDLKFTCLASKEGKIE
jgi:hypothetical protein